MSRRPGLRLLLFAAAGKAADGSFQDCAGAKLPECLDALALVGLRFGETWHLAQTCGDENPVLQLLAEPQRLPPGRIRQLLLQQAESADSAYEGISLLRSVAAVTQRSALRFLEVAAGHGYACFVRGACAAPRAAVVALAAVRSEHLRAMAVLLQQAAAVPQEAPWPSGLQGPAAAVARRSFDPRHLDFSKSVHDALETESFQASVDATSVLHDLALRIAVAGCALQAELLAFTTVCNMLGKPLVQRLPDFVLPRFEFHTEGCCRRYHVLANLLGRLQQGPLRLLEVGVNNAITSEYLLSRFANLQFDGVDPYIDVEDIYAEATARLQPFSDRSRLWRRTSAAAAVEFEPATFDVIFIDGDHSHDAVVEDLKIWRSRVRPGGLLAGHDLFNLAFEGVLEALVESLATRGAPETIHFGFDFVWWLQM